jgi:hypothetical protein
MTSPFESHATGRASPCEASPNKNRLVSIGRLPTVRRDPVERYAARVVHPSDEYLRIVIRVSARLALVCEGEGFRMPARRDLSARAEGEGPHDRRAAEKGDQFAPPHPDTSAQTGNQRRLEASICGRTPIPVAAQRPSGSPR